MKKSSLKKLYLICIVIIIFLLFIFMIDNRIKNKVSSEIYSFEISENKEILWNQLEDEYDIDINNIIQENNNNKIVSKYETITVQLEYETEYKNNNELPKGYMQVLQQGQDGTQQLTIRKQYEGENLISDEQIGRKTLTPSINRIVEVGTSSSYNSYTIEIGDIVYATPYDLNIMDAPFKEANVIIKISQNAEMKIIKKEKNWYYIKYENYYGWVEKDCVTYKIPKSQNFNNITTQKSKSNLINSLSFDMELNKPSGLTIEQFEKIFENESRDKYGTFKNNARYFYYVEQAYGINGVFLAAIGIHESNWGTSKIALDKKNLFGYGAYDMNAYASAYNYNGYEAGIDMVARVLIKYYLNPKGTSIYNGEVATGSYYNGNNLKGVNTRYATDKNWANGVYNWMKYLYNKI